MGNLLIEFYCKVNGGFSPNGLQKVFLSYHPSDKSEMEQIKAEILELVDCAVFHHCTAATVELKDINIKDYDLKLREMKLFVILITEKYLLNESLSKNFEFEFALKHGIPIIPIALESKLEELFQIEMNKVRKGLGDIQLLKRFISDKTEIPYSQKLIGALNSVLVDKKQINKIKEAFTKRIFLSYRKKCRIYANELIRTIHSIPSLERTAIWYDEFLSSGEKWDNQIQEAISNCDVFLLLVTPIITESDNYVLREEYPAAKSLKKPIIFVNKAKNCVYKHPVKELEKVFPDLNVIINGDDVSELENVLKQFGNTEKRTLEQDFLIGLAYFNGIEVEIDIDKAISLIVASAKGGLPDAISKLADMYWYGNGIAVNYENSILWKKELVAIYEKRLSKSQNSSNLIDYTKALIDLISCLYELGTFRESLKFGKKLSEILKSNVSFTPENTRYLASAYDFCGRNSLRLGCLTDAVIYSKKYCELSEEQHVSENTLENRHNLAVAYERAGNSYYEMRDFESAEEWYSKSLGIHSQIHDELDSSESAYSLSSLYLDIGDVYIKKGKYKEACQLISKAVELRKKILDARENDENKKIYSEAVISLGTAFLYLDNIHNAENLFLEGMNITGKLAENKGTIETQYNYSLAINRYAKIMEQKAKYNEALQYYMRSLEIRKEILSKSRTVNTVFEYATSLYYVAHIHELLFQSSEAKKKYDELITVIEPILPKDEKKDEHYLFAKAAFNRFKLDTFSGKRYLQYAINAMEWLTEQCEDNIKYRKLYKQYCMIYKRCYPNQL